MPNPVGPRLTQPSALERKPLRLWQLFFLLLVFFSALLVRRVGLSFGAPLFTHPDEQNVLIPVVESVRLDQNVYKYAHPTQVLYRLNKNLLNPYSLWRNGFNLAEWYDRDLYGIYLASRSITMVLGALLPVMAFFIGRRFKPDFSVPAALLFAFFPQYVLHSHYITPDIPITFYTLGVLLASLLWLEGRGKAWIWVAALFAALNTADKFPGVISLGIIGLSMLIRLQQEGLPFKWFLRQGVLVVAFYIAAIFLVAPNLFLQYKDVISAVTIEARDYHLGNDGFNWLGKMAYYVKVYWDYANPWLLLFTILGILGLFRTRQAQGWLLAYGLLYAALLSTLALHHERWALPMFITPLLLAAYGAAWLPAQLGGRTWLKGLAWLAAAVMLGLNAAKGVTESVYMDLPDTSAIGLHYLDEHGIRQDQTLSEGYSPFAPFGKPDIYGFDFASPGDIDYVILSDKMYGRYQAEPQRYQRENSFYERLRANGQLMLEWQPYPKPVKLSGQLELILYYLNNRPVLSSLDRYSGYTIQVYKLNQ
jgi:hypothetical protein